MGDREKYVAAALFVLISLAIPVVSSIQPATEDPEKRIPFMLNTALLELRLDTSAKLFGDELQSSLPEAQLFDTESWISSSDTMNTADRTTFLGQLAVACIALDRTEDASLLMEKGELDVEPTHPFAFLLSDEPYPGMVQLKRDIQASTLPPWVTSLLVARYEKVTDSISTEEGVKPAEAHYASALAEGLRSYATSVAVLLGCLALVFLGGIAVLFLSPRILGGNDESERLLTMYRFGAPPIQTFLVFAAWLAISFALSVGLSMLLSDEISDAWFIMIAYVATAVAGVLLVKSQGVLHTESLLHAVDLDLRGISGRAVLLGILGYAAAIPVVFVLRLLSDLLLSMEGGINPVIPILVGAGSQVDRWVVIINVVIMAPLFEEFLFRGFLFQQFKRFFGLANSVALSALVFAAVHGSMEDFLPLFGLGVVLAVVYHYTQSLWSAMLTHALWNLGTVVVVTTLFA